MHGQRIDVPAPDSANASHKSDVVGKRFGLGNMTFDAVARHPAFCDARQLYDLRKDPLEQHNLAREHPAKCAELLAVLEAHVLRVESANPAVARQAATLSGSRGGVAAHFGCLPVGRRRML